MKVSIGPYKDDGERDAEVVIEDGDTHDLLSTLSMIIVPALRKYRENHSGAPIVANQDVPEELRSDAELEALDDKFFARWHWVLDEMIWAHEKVLDDEWDPNWTDVQLQEHEDRKRHGLLLFGKYYQALWS